MVDELPGATLLVEIDYHHKIYLMEHSERSEGIMSDALNFAQGVAADIGVPDMASAWRLVILRYHSESAEDDWSQGRWAPDVNWEYISSYRL